MEALTRNRFTKYIPFVGLFIIFALYHVLILPCYGDDVNLFQGVLDNQTVFEYLRSRYQTWSSRIVIEAVLVQMVKYQFIWKVFDTLIAVMCAWLLSWLIDKEHKYAWHSCILFLLYPFIDMSTAGWISTTLNYLWPLCAMLVLCVILKKSILDERLKVSEYILGSVCAIFACNHEQVAVVVFILFVGMGIAYWYKNKKCNVFASVILVIDMLSLLFIFTCPGNSTRVEQSGGLDYDKFSLVKKLELGLLNIERIFISNFNYFFIAFALLLFFLLWRTQKNKKQCLAALPMLFVLGGYQVLNRVFPICENIFVVPQRSFEIAEFSPSTLIKLGMLAILMLAILLCIYILVDKKWNVFFHLFLVLAAGFGSAVMLGISPSVFASDTRIFIFLYVSLIYTLLFCVKINSRKVKISKYEKYIFGAIVFFYTAYNVLYVISNIIGRRSWSN